MRVRKELLFIKQEQPFELYEGEEWALDESLLLGCDGAVAGFASTAGALMKKLAADIDAGDFPGAAKIQRHLLEIYYAVYGPLVTWWTGGAEIRLAVSGHHQNPGRHASPRRMQCGVPARHHPRVRGQESRRASLAGGGRGDEGLSRSSVLDSRAGHGAARSSVRHRQYDGPARVPRRPGYPVRGRRRGVTCLDTAAVYGESETVLGKALAELGLTDTMMWPRK